MTSEARQLYLDLMLLSHGGTVSWNPAGGSVPDSRAPTGESRPPHELFAQEYERKGQSAVRFWREELKRWRGGGQVPAKGKTDREIVLEAGEGHAADDVAMRFRLTATMVRRWRLEDGRNVDTGRRVQVKGRTQRQIAEELGVSQPTVSRMRRAA